VNARPSLRERLSQRQSLIALLQTHPNPALSEMAANCGYDVVILDDEHGVFNAGDFLQSIRLLTGTQTAVFVRIREGDMHAIGRFLDMGADGIVVPGVCTAEQASACVRAMIYPPLGIRGFAASVHRSTRHGQDVSEHMRAPRGHAALAVMIESAASVENIESILSVEGVDAAIVGPSDLSANLGMLGDFASSAYVHAMSRIESAAVTSGKVLGTAPHPGHSVESLSARGHRFFIAGADTMLIREALASALERTRSALPSAARQGASQP